MKTSTFIRSFLVASLFLLMQSSHVFSASFTKGNLVVTRAVVGSGAWSNVFLDEYTPSGTLVQTVTLPTAVSGANQPFGINGTAINTGALNLSTDKRFLVLGGYSSSAQTTRVIATVDNTAAINTSTTYAGSGPVRSVASTNGTDLWIADNLGISYTTLGSVPSTTSLSAFNGNIYNVGIYDNKLYFCTEISPYQFGYETNGLPTTGTTQPYTVASTAPIAAYGFVMFDTDASIPGVDVMYVAEANIRSNGVSNTPKGVVKYCLNSSGVWVSKGAVAHTDGIKQVTGVYNSATGAITLYAVTQAVSGTTIFTGTVPTSIVSLTDNSGYNGTLSGTFTTLATSAATYAFKGIAFAPIVAVPYSPTVPEAPLNVVATAGNAQASVAFSTPNNNGGSVITGYTVTPYIAGVAQTTVTGTGSPIVVTGLTNGTAYTFKVIATNAVGNSVASTASAAVTPFANAPTFDSDKLAVTYDSQYSQLFNTTWDNTTFYNQWITLLANAFSATDIAGGSLQFAWAAKRALISQKKYYSPYLFETELDYSSGSTNNGGVVIRFNQVNYLDEVQEPVTSGPGFNSRGIAFYPTIDGSSMIVQFTGEYVQNATPVTRILVPKPAGVTSLFQKGKIRIEDFGTSIYVYYNDLAFCRINLADKVGSYFTSGTVYDANLGVLGTFSNMHVDQTGQVSVAQRNALLKLYSVLLKYKNLKTQTIINDIGVKKNTDSPFPLAANASSGLPVSYMVVSGPATVSGNTLSLTGIPGLVTVSAFQAGDIAYFPTDSIFSFMVSNASASTQTVQNKSFSDEWVATDGIGRTLPQYSDCTDYRQGKYVGIGYYNYQQIFSNPSKFQTFPELLKDNPASPAFEWNVNYYWGEPENGYYHPSDPWVIRRHLQLLANAGVDFVYFDFTNGDQGDQNLDSYMTVAMDMYNKGIPVPKVSFFLNESYNTAMQSILKKIYSHPEYEPMLFKWQGKPLLMADSVKCFSQYPPAAAKGIKDYFTWRTTWAFAGGQWNFTDNYPQRYFTYNGQPEQMPVGKAIGAPLGTDYQTKGSSYHNGQAPPFDQYWETDQTKFGYFFTEQWSRAFQVDPSIVCINGFNELRARAWISDASKPVPFMGKQWDDPSWRCVNQATCSHKDASGNHTPHGWYAVDEFNTEFNRDIEPSNDENTDNFYYQAISNIRKFKGMAAPQAFSAPTTIAVDGNFAEWAAVTPVYRDVAGDVQNRNFKNAYGTSVLTNSTARNDIVESRATYDANNIYFYVKTVAPISPSTDPNWMLLFIDSDRNKGTGWEGYDYVVNLGVTSASQTTLKQWTGSAWGNAISTTYKVVGNEMELSVPRSALKMTTGTPEFYFHWSDNAQQLNDITAFFTDGESAPDRRFNYNFSTSKIATLPETPYKTMTIPGTVEFEDFDNGGAEIAYADATFGNQGGAYRLNESVDIENTTGGGYAVTKTNSNEWLRYTVTVNVVGTVTASIKYASLTGNNQATIFVDENNKSGLISFPSTANLQTFATKDVDLLLPAGQHVLKFFINKAADDFNLDKITFTNKSGVYPGTGTGLARSNWKGAAPGIWFKDSICSQVDPTINQTWASTDSPGCSIPSTFWNVRWRGQLEPLYTETYTFYLTIQDLGKLWVNNQLLISQWSGSALGNTFTATMNLTAGQKVPIRVDFAKKTSDAKIKLEWSSTTNPREVVPMAQLYPTSGTSGIPDVNTGYFSVYPNPATNKLSINCWESQVDAIRIIDLQGRTVFSKNERFNGQKNLDISLEKGIYFIHLIGSKSFKTQKIIIE